MSFELLLSDNEVNLIKREIRALKTTQADLAEDMGISDRQIRNILSDQIASRSEIDIRKLEILLRTLKRGYKDVLSDPDNIRAYQNEMRATQERGWEEFQKTEKNLDASDRNYLNNPVAQKSYIWGLSRLQGKISEHYKMVYDFLVNYTSFREAPETGHWDLFETDPDFKKNYYCEFLITPGKAEQEFKIYYTMETGFKIRRVNILRIEYAKIISGKDCIHVHQYYNPFPYYKIPAMKEIRIVTYIDEMRHKFIVGSNDEFKMSFERYENTRKINSSISRSGVKRNFDDLSLVVFQRHPYFHRKNQNDAGDEHYFFLSNEKFMALNTHIEV